MSDQSRDPGLPPHTTPRWVKVAAIVAVVMALLVAIVLLLGGGPGRHGPGRHLPGGDGVDTLPAAAIEGHRHLSAGGLSITGDLGP